MAGQCAGMQIYCLSLGGAALVMCEPYSGSGLAITLTATSALVRWRREQLNVLVYLCEVEVEEVAVVCDVLTI